MRCLVTGAAGFAGSHLAELLLARGREVFGLMAGAEDDRNLRPALSGPAAARLHLLAGDLLDRPRLAEIVAEVRPDEVYHLAALSSVRHSLEDPAATFSVNVLGTQNLFEALRAAGGRPRVLCVGSAEAYGESASLPRPLVEEDPLLPVTPYGTSKAAVEQVARRYVERGLPVVRVRPFPHTGPRQSAQFVFPDIARQLAEIRRGARPPLLEVGNLQVRRDLTDVRDMAAAYLLAVERGEPGAVYNLCAGRAWALREVLARLVAESRLAVEVRVRRERLRAQDLEVLIGDPTAFRQRTGWQAAIPLARTMADLLAYWQARLEEEPVP